MKVTQIIHSDEVEKALIASHTANAARAESLAKLDREHSLRQIRYEMCLKFDRFEGVFARAAKDISWLHKIENELRYIYTDSLVLLGVDIEDEILKLRELYPQNTEATEKNSE